MTTLGALLVGLLLLLVLLGVAAWMRRRSRRGREQPRTVAELVRMRENAAQPQPDVVEQAEVETAASDNEAADDATGSVVASGTASPDVVEPTDAPAPPAVSEPDQPGPTVVPVPRPEDAVVDTPWARAARMADPRPAWCPPPSQEHAVDLPRTQSRPVDDAGVRPAPEARPAAPAETSGVAPVERVVDGPIAPHTDRPAEASVGSAVERPAATLAESSAPVVPPQPGPPADAPDAPADTSPRRSADATAPSRPRVDASAPPHPRPPADAPDAPADAPPRPSADAADPHAASPPEGEPTAVPAPTEALAPEPTAAVNTSTNGHTRTPARITGRVRRSPSATADEQAAADLALLRTFGIAGPTTVEPDVELEGCVTDADEPASGTAQPVGLRVLGRDGRGIAGAAVTLLDDHGRETATTRTDSDGHGVLTARHPGGYMLVAAAEGYQPGAITVAVTDGPVDAEIPLTRSASITGTVGGEDGPVVGAHLALVQDGEIVDTAHSTADGTYRFADLAAGEYGLSVTAPECEPAALVLGLADEAELRQDVELVPAGLPADDVITA